MCVASARARGGCLRARAPTPPPSCRCPSAAAATTQTNRTPFVLWLLGKATARWTRGRPDQRLLLPAFNGLQVDFLRAGSGVVAASRQLNEAAAALVASHPGAAQQLGLASCAWVLDDAATAGGLVCTQHGRVGVAQLLGQPTPVQTAAAPSGRRLLQAEAGAAGGRHVLLPANPALSLRVYADGKLRREVKGLAAQAQLLDLSGSAQELQLSWAA